jgi:hypothetical protein
MAGRERLVYARFAYGFDERQAIYDQGNERLGDCTRDGVATGRTEDEC